MSYYLRVSDDAGNSAWFNNSWLALDEIRSSFGKVSPHNVYEYQYNVKLHRGGILYTTEYVEFPSESEATMFVLRWS